MGTLFDDAEPETIALVRLRVGLGDLLCGVPALRALRRRLPDARVTLVSYPEVRGVMARVAPWVDDLLAFPGHPGIPERPPRPQAWPRFLADARARRFDVAIQAYGARPAVPGVPSPSPPRVAPSPARTQELLHTTAGDRAVAPLDLDADC